MLAFGDGGRGGLLEIARDLFTAAKISLHPVGCGQAIGERAGLVGERLLEVDDFLLPGSRRGFCRGCQLVRAFTRLEGSLLADCLRFAFGLTRDLIGLRASPVDAGAHGSPGADQPVGDGAARNGRRDRSVGEIAGWYSHA